MCMQNTMHVSVRTRVRSIVLTRVWKKAWKSLIYAFHILLQAKIQYENVMPMRAYRQANTLTRTHMRS